MYYGFKQTKAKGLGMETVNMVTMLQSESFVSREERSFNSWLSKVSSMIGFPVDENGLAFDLYNDSCSVVDAVAEITARINARIINRK